MKNFLFIGKTISEKSTMLYNLVKRTEFSCRDIIFHPFFIGGKKNGANVIDIQLDERRVLSRVKRCARFSRETVGSYVISEERIKHDRKTIKKAIGTCGYIVINGIGTLESSEEEWIKEAEQAFERGNIVAIVRKSFREKFLETYGKRSSI